MIKKNAVLNKRFVQLRILKNHIDTSYKKETHAHMALRKLTKNIYYCISNFRKRAQEEIYKLNVELTSGDILVTSSVRINMIIKHSDVSEQTSGSQVIGKV